MVFSIGFLPAVAVRPATVSDVTEIHRKNQTSGNFGRWPHCAKTRAGYGAGMSVWLELAIVIGLILLNAFFALAEMAIVSSRRLRLQQMAEAGRPGAAQALTLADNPGRFLSAVQVGITLIGILSGAFGGATLGVRLAPFLDRVPGIAPHGGQIAVALVVVGITALSVMIGEIVPKRVALAAPERIAVRVARPIQILVLAARPFVWLLERSTSAMLAPFGVPERRLPSVTEEEVRFAIAEGTEAGVIDEVEEEMIHGVLALADRSVASIMTPRPDVYWIDLEDERELIAREVADCPHSRLVIARGDLGHPLGVVQKKDLVEDLIGGLGLDLQRHMREPVYVPENAEVLRVLEMFRKVPLHVAFVVDEYGDFQGLVTLTDVLQGIAGQLREEHMLQPEEAIMQRADGSWLVDGRAPIGRLIDMLGLAETAGDYHTAAGLALHRLERIPLEGDRFTIDGWTAEVVDMDGKRIDKLLFVPAERRPATRAAN
jgi:putative hemolysin